MLTEYSIISRYLHNAYRICHYFSASLGAPVKFLDVSSMLTKSLGWRLRVSQMLTEYRLIPRSLLMYTIWYHFPELSCLTEFLSFLGISRL